MDTNTLVRHKQLKSVGIGCISKMLSKKAKVNFGTEDVMTCSLSALVEVDTSKCKTMTFSDFKAKNFTNNHSELVIIGNEVKQYVGIGWVTIRVVTEDDLKKYKRLVH